MATTLQLHRNIECVRDGHGNGLFNKDSLTLAVSPELAAQQNNVQPRALPARCLGV